MPRWLESKLDRKAQFFIISTVIITVFLTSISSLFRDYSKTDLSEVPNINGGEVFYNIKNNIRATARETSCPGEEKRRERNLRELKHFIQEESIKKGVGVNITYRQFCPTLRVSMRLTSENFDVKDQFEY